MYDVKKVAVIGSGVMGASIAAHIANAGYQVYLFDITPKDAVEHNILAKNAISKLHTLNPKPLASPEIANNIIPFSLDYDFDKMKEVDWIIEAIIENLEIKRALYKKLEQVAPPQTIISSNTSTLPLNELTKDLSQNFQQNFIITHFFNPPRYMRLLELIFTNNTTKDLKNSISEFCSQKLGKEIVLAKDTPGFIANRIGCFWLELGMNEAINLGAKIDQIDAIFGKPLGIPASGIFGLVDLIGLDVMQLIAKSFHQTLPSSDKFCQVNHPQPLIEAMIADGYIGRKGKGGFYTISQDDSGKKIKLVKNLKTGQYEKPLPGPDYSKMKIIDILAQNDINQLFTSRVLCQFFAYTASLVPEIADNIYQIDLAMKTGYNWRYGPFELMDLLGIDWIKQEFAKYNIDLPTIFQILGNNKFYNNNSYFSFPSSNYSPIPIVNNIKLSEKLVTIENNDSCMRNLGEDIYSFELKTKMNVLTADSFSLLQEAIKYLSNKNGKGLIITSNNDNFCAGANLNFFLENARAENWQAIKSFMDLGQQTMVQIKYAPFPIISTAKGYCLGGGCELLLHSYHIQAYIETIAGLVETSVGLIPGWGGTKEIILRSIASSSNPNQQLENLLSGFNNILHAQRSSSAQEMANLWKLTNFSLTMNTDILLNEAISTLKTLNFIPKQPGKIFSYQCDLMDKLAQTIAENSKLSEHDQNIAKILARIFTNVSNEFSEQDLLNQEQEALIDLLKLTPTQQRIEYMLQNGKPLKN